MLIKLCRFVVFLCVFICQAAALHGVRIDSRERTDNISKRSDDYQRIIGAKGSSLDERGTTSGSATRKVFERLVYAVAVSKSKESTDRIRRNRDVDSADGTDASTRKEGSASSQNSVLSSSTLEGLVARHSKHRRRRRCKNRLGCWRFAGRNGTASSGAIDRSDDNDESRNDRANDHHPARDRNFEKQLLLGNRSLELFRQELIASATTLGDASPRDTLDPSSRQIGDILADSRSRCPKDQPETLASNILWRTLKLDNGTISATKYDKAEETELNGNLSSARQESDGLSDRSVREKSATEAPKDHRGELPESMQYEFNLTEEEGAVGWPSDDRRSYVKGKGNGDSLPMHDRTVVHESLAALLSRLFDTLGNTTAMGKSSSALLRDLEATREWLDGENSSDDMCRKWLDSKDKLEEAFLGPLVYLPSCPCQYPSGIFYDDKVWDPKQEKYFRWRDVNGDVERMDVYKPGAAYCVRSLLNQGSGHAAAQHCCYDRQRRLLTRGSGAGTPNFVSPEISPELHERIDVLPWRLCKGDFSRFNRVRPPNNDNRCKTNPDDDEYRRQINYTKHY